MTTTVDDYFQAGWRERSHTCAACEWQGTSRQMVMELHDELTEYVCPQCENPLLLVVHPDLSRIQTAAAAGNAEAQSHLEILASAPRPD